MKRAVVVLTVSALAAAVTQELRKSVSERDWIGELGGVVPYDLRPPTFKRLVSRLWSPDDPRIMMPNGFGVGWTVDFGRLVRMAWGR
jgi:hypothetical protein